MLSSVLGSQRAIAVNIEIMRTFVRVRALATTPRKVLHVFRDLTLSRRRLRSTLSQIRDLLLTS